MKTSKAARRYARAMFDVASRLGVEAEARADFAALAALLRDSADFHRLVHDPVRSVDQQQEALRALLEDRAHPVVLQSLLLLAQQSRLPELAGICAHFEALYCERHGILKASIVSAAPMQDAQIAAIRDRLQRRYARTVDAEVRLDPALVGGFKVHLGDTVLDYSIRAQLQRLREELIHA